MVLIEESNTDVGSDINESLIEASKPLRRTIVEIINSVHDSSKAESPRTTAEAEEGVNYF